MVYSDKSLACAQCGQEFTFSADDQQYHASRGYQDPKRCPSCRAERRNSQGGGSYGSSYGGGSGGYDDPSVDEALAVFVDQISKRDPRMAQVYFDISGVAGLGDWEAKKTIIAARIRLHIY